jgi:predicted NAD/FAD-binding protein
MRIAIVGAGIAGLASAYLLGRAHELTVYEAAPRLGGHTHTHDIERFGRRYSIDTGFIVFNPDYYPLLSRLFRELGVESQPTTMSFSVRNELTGLEYNATNLNRLFCQRRNLFSPRFWGMVRDLLRFYRESPALLRDPSPGPGLGEYLASKGYGRMFIDEHLVPMASALWSSPSTEIMNFPAKHMVQFMANHQMLDPGTRKPWRVVRGGSARYLDKLVPAIRGEIRSGVPVRALHRERHGVRLVHDGGEARYDHVVLACHSDQALAMLAEPTAAEREVLSAIRYQRNDTVLHTDASLLPRHPLAWAAWNALRLKPDPRTPEKPACTVSYHMNQLQSIDSPEPFVVTLNATHRIDPARIIARMDYAHPIFDGPAVAAQQRWAEISGRDRISYAGAWWGWGFHEDGMRSAVRVAAALGVVW